MKTKNLFILAHKSNKGLSKKIIFIALITLVFLLIFLPFTFYNTYNWAASVIINFDDTLRVIEVNDTQAFSKLDLSSQKHIVKYLEDYTLYHCKHGYIYELNDKYSIDLYPSFKYFEQPKAVKGSNLKSEYDLVCPLRMAFGAFDDENINDFTDMSKYLNKELEFTFYKEVGFDEEKQEDILEPYKYKFKLVGLYDASASYSYNRCYIKEDTLNDIATATYPYNPLKYAQITALYIDDYKNIAEVDKFLTDNNIDHFVPSLDIDFLDVVLKSSFILIILFIVFSIILIINYLNIFIKEREHNLALYKALGFDVKDIKTIMFFSVLELLIYSLLIALIITFIIKYALLFVLRNNVTYYGMKIPISYLPVCIFILIHFYFFVNLIYHYCKES